MSENDSKAESCIEVEGLHNPQHVTGTVEVEVDIAYFSEEAGREVRLWVRYPNGTVSTVRFLPDRADELAEWLKETSEHVRFLRDRDQ
jgi:hypothetical protein